MVRTYKRKTNAGEWPQEKMIKASFKVQTKELTYVELLKFTNYHTRVYKEESFSLDVSLSQVVDSQQLALENAEKILADRLLHLASRGFIHPRRFVTMHLNSQNVKKLNTNLTVQ